MELNKLTIKQARKKLVAGEITSVELTKACLTRVKEVDGKIKACLTVCEERALSEAAEADKRIKAGEKGDLLGVPYFAKDNILTKGVKTTAASKILENYIAPFDATIIKRLQAVGAVLLGKTNLDEFAHGASTENSAYGPTHNPWDLKRVPGGSSGGSGAAVAADMCMFAMGTDTGGSVRCPASFCGVVGLKPTYGRSSRFGLISMTSSTDVPGPITKTIEDAYIVLKAIEGVDKHDATTKAKDGGEENIFGDIKGKRIGLPEEYLKEGINDGVKKVIETAIEKLKELGAEIVPITLPYAKYGIPVYYIITPSEISSNLARFDGIRYGFSDQEAEDIIEVYKKSRGKGFGPEVKRRIMLGTYALSSGYYDAYYLKAQKVRTKIKEELDGELEKLDAIITPTSPHVAFEIGKQSDDPLAMYMEDVYVNGASLAGLPAVSVPCGFSDDMPVGLQLVGKRFDDEMVLKIGRAYEDATEWGEKRAEV